MDKGLSKLLLYKPSVTLAVMQSAPAMRSGGFWD